MHDALLPYALLCQYSADEATTTIPASWTKLDNTLELPLAAEYHASAHFFLSENHLIIVIQGNAFVEGESDIAEFGRRCIASLEIIEEKISSTIGTFSLAEGTSIHFTGFSLGAMLAEILAVKSNTPAVTFESPGIARVLEEIPDRTPDATDLLTTVLTVPNPVNTHDEHIGRIYRIKIDHVAQSSYQHTMLAIGDWALKMAQFFMLIKIYGNLKQNDIIKNAIAYNQDLLKRQQDIFEYKTPLYEIDVYGFPAVAPNILRTEEHLQEQAAAGNLYAQSILAFRDIISCLKHHQTNGHFYTFSYLTSLTALTWKNHKNISKKRSPNNFSLEKILEALEEKETIHDINSWPTRYLPNQSWRAFFKKLFIPQRGMYLFAGENAYLEHQRTTSIPGYREGERVVDITLPRSNEASTPTDAAGKAEAEEKTEVTLSHRDMTSGMANLFFQSTLHAPKIYRHLQILRLSHNALDGAIQDDLIGVLCAEHINLIELDLSHNRINWMCFIAIIDVAFEKQAQLKDIDFSHNHIVLRESSRFVSQDTAESASASASAFAALQTARTVNISGNILLPTAKFKYAATAEQQTAREAAQRDSIIDHAFSSQLIKHSVFKSTVIDLTSIVPDNTEMLDARNGFVYLMAVKPNLKLKEHAFIFIEYLDSSGHRLLRQYEIFDDGHIHANYKTPEEIYRAIETDNYQYGECSWKLPMRELHPWMERLNDKTLADDVPFSKTGSSSPGTHNCISWAIAQLKRLMPELNMKSHPKLPPSLVVQGYKKLSRQGSWFSFVRS